MDDVVLLLFLRKMARSPLLAAARTNPVSGRAFLLLLLSYLARAIQPAAD